jgi:transposase InsO family protein
MAYVTSPYASKARRLAVQDVRKGRLNINQAASRYGVHRTTIWRWLKRASLDHREFIETKKSSPKSHPNQLSPEIVNEIIKIRKENNRCAPVVHARMIRNGYKASLSSVERTLKRNHLTRKQKRTKGIRYKINRPSPVEYPGQLVEMDTIHLVRPDYSRFYIYTVIDVFTRLAHAYYSTHFQQKVSFKVILKAQKIFGFNFDLVQTDNGHEFGISFQRKLLDNNIALRYTRIRKPNDNAHIERFNRTIQEELFRGNYPNEKYLNKKISKYLKYYNESRLHLSLNCLTPREYVAKVLK